MSYTIEDYMLNDLNLSGNELLTYAFLTSEGVYEDTLEHMRGQVGMKSITTLKNTLRSLVDRGLITITKEGINSPTTYSVVNDLNTCVTSVEGGYEPPRSGGINPKEVLRKGVKNRRSLLD